MRPRLDWPRATGRKALILLGAAIEGLDGIAGEDSQLASVMGGVRELRRWKWLPKWLPKIRATPRDDENARVLERNQ